jgi:hypothetical protein
MPDDRGIDLRRTSQSPAFTDDLCSFLRVADQVIIQMGIGEEIQVASIDGLLPTPRREPCGAQKFSVGALR